MQDRRDFGLDLLRALAIGLVLLLHAKECATPSAWFAAVCRTGWVGVDLFFVLSGYLVGAQAMQKLPFDRRALLHFWWRRWTRTIPLYAVVLVTYVVVKPLVFRAPFQGEAWRFFIFVQNFWEFRDFAQSWSLCIEEQFYFATPIVLALFVPRRAWVWLLPMGLSIAVRGGLVLFLGSGLAELTLPEHERLFRFDTFAHLDGIACGLFLAATRSRWQALSGLVRRAMGLAGGSIFAASAAAFEMAPRDGTLVVSSSLLAVGAAGAVVGVHGLARPRLVGPVVEKLALWSYGAYLWNNLLIRVFAHHPLPGHWSLTFAVFIGGSFGIAWATYELVEKPGLALRRRLAFPSARAPS